MPKYHGKNALIYFGGVNMTGQSNKWDLNVGIDGTDSSVFGDVWDSSMQGSPNWTGQVSGVAASEGGASGALLTDKLFDFIDDGDKPLLIYPVGGGSAKPYFYGTGYLSGMPLSGGRKDMYGYSASFKGGENGQLFNLKTA